MSSTKTRRFTLGDSVAPASPSVLESILFFLAYWGPPRLRSRDVMASLYLQVDWAVAVNALVWFGVFLWVFNEFNAYALVERRIPRAPASVVAAVLLGFVLMSSAVVSVSPLLTLYKGIQLGLTVLFGFFWVLRFGVSDVLRRLTRCACFVSISLLVAGFALPGVVWIGPRLMGGTVGNSGAVSALLLVALLAGASLDGKTKNQAAFAAGAILLALSQTRTAYVAVVLGVIVAAAAGPRGVGARRVAVLASAVVPLVLLTEVWRGIASYIIRDSASLSTMSDRVPLWRTLFAQALANSPVLGMGFYASRSLTLAYNPGIGTAHSAYVEVAIGAGVLGVLALSLTIVLVARSLARHRMLADTHSTHRNATVAAALTATCLVLGLTSEEMVTGGPTSLTFFAMCAVAADLVIAASKDADYGRA